MSFTYEVFFFIGNPGWNFILSGGSFGALVLLCAYYLLRGRFSAEEPDSVPPPPGPAGRETLADVPDIWSFRPKPGLRDSQNEPVVPPPPPFIPKRPDGFLSSLWPTALQDPAFNAEPFFSLSRVLHHETHSVYKLITERSTWSPADRDCLQRLVTRAQIPNEREHADCLYFTCPPASIAPEIVERCDAWALVNGLMNMEGNSKPVVTSLQINERMGRCIFGSMELGLAKMNSRRRRTSSSAHPMANDSEVRCKEVDAWLALRQQSNFTLAAFKQAYADGGGVSFSRAVLALQQDHEALWEMNRRKGNSSIVFKKAMRKMYDETDRAVIRRLAAAHGRPEEDFRFYQAGNLCDEDFIDPGRAVTYQVRARPGERVPGKKAGTFGKIELVVVNEGDTAWVDLPEKDVMPVYLDAFYHACGGDKWSPDMSPEAFAEAMGQYFGDRLPVEYLKEGE